MLTSDYEGLDLVLVQRYIPPKQQDAADAGVLPAKPTGVSVPAHPDHKSPQRRRCRAARPAPLYLYRAGTLAQYEKLLSAYTVAAWSAPYFNNRALFSDYYLTERLCHERQSGRRTLRKRCSRHAYKALRSLYADARETFPASQYATVRQA